VPQTNLTSLDPVWTTATVTRNFAMMVYENLYGRDEQFVPKPLMVEGHVIDDDGRRWTMKLRDGLIWHDGTKVLGRDCAASIRRWGARDAFGQALMAAANEIGTDGDRVITVRLKRPFPLLPDALGKTMASMCPMMPERLATTDPFKPIIEAIGSGPYRYKADERVPGARVVYERYGRARDRSD